MEKFLVFFEKTRIFALKCLAVLAGLAMIFIFLIKFLQGFSVELAYLSSFGGYFDCKANAWLCSAYWASKALTVWGLVSSLVIGLKLLKKGKAGLEEVQWIFWLGVVLLNVVVIVGISGRYYGFVDERSNTESFFDILMALSFSYGLVHFVFSMAAFIEFQIPDALTGDQSSRDTISLVIVVPRAMIAVGLMIGFGMSLLWYDIHTPDSLPRNHPGRFEQQQRARKEKYCGDKFIVVGVASNFKVVAEKDCWRYNDLRREEQLGKYLNRCDSLQFDVEVIKKISLLPQEEIVGATVKFRMSGRRSNIEGLKRLLTQGETTATDNSRPMPQLLIGTRENIDGVEFFRTKLGNGGASVDDPNSISESKDWCPRQ